MSTTVGKTEWPHLVADLRAKRDALTNVIAILETTFLAPSDSEVAQAIDEPSVARGRKPKKAEKRTNERTNERARTEPRRQARRSLPDDAVSAAILAQLRKRGPLSPGELAAAVQLSVPNLRYRLKPLTAQGLVEMTGTTMSRRVRLAGKHPAKEDL